MHARIVHTIGDHGVFIIPNVFMLHYAGALVDLNIEIQHWVRRVLSCNASKYLITGLYCEQLPI